MVRRAAGLLHFADKITLCVVVLATIAVRAGRGVLDGGNTASILADLSLVGTVIRLPDAVLDTTLNVAEVLGNAGRVSAGVEPVKVVRGTAGLLHLADKVALHVVVLPAVAVGTRGERLGIDTHAFLAELALVSAVIRLPDSVLDAPFHVTEVLGNTSRVSAGVESVKVVRGTTGLLHLTNEMALRVVVLPAVAVGAGWERLGIDAHAILAELALVGAVICLPEAVLDTTLNVTEVLGNTGRVSAGVEPVKVVSRAAGLRHLANEMALHVVVLATVTVRTFELSVLRFGISDTFPLLAYLPLIGAVVRLPDAVLDAPFKVAEVLGNTGRVSAGVEGVKVVRRASRLRHLADQVALRIVILPAVAVGAGWERLGIDAHAILAELALVSAVICLPDAVLDATFNVAEVLRNTSRVSAGVESVKVVSGTTGLLHLANEMALRVVILPAVAVGAGWERLGIDAHAILAELALVGAVICLPEAVLDTTLNVAEVLGNTGRVRTGVEGVKVVRRASRLRHLADQVALRIVVLATVTVRAVQGGSQHHGYQDCRDERSC